ncbi:MAG TPA: hydantoinase/oxoprolinase family protein [Streptosporangiaceae bacterium]|nr:hydantoinase/oxoprolinase family protein [Streptosporangiaceae bacterium]
MPDIRVAVDIGGTFTDLVAQDTATGQVIRAKADTTPGALEHGVLTALAQSGVAAGQVSAFIHGTTLVINTVTERTGARTGLVTTSGFRDVLEIGRGNRPDLYNLAYRKPEPFVPRHLRLEVTERMTYQGQVVEPLDVAELEQAASQLEAQGVRAVAVCFLHAWANPAHEQQAAEILAARLPGVSVVASHWISGQWREYERTSTAVLSAYVRPVVAAYLGSLATALRDTGLAAPLYAMRSNGGVSSFEQAARVPIALLESGPVAGVAAAAELGRRIGARHVLTLDVGGTTAKTAAVRDGEIKVTTLHHIGKEPARAGYPVQSPTVEIVEIGAGGGSIAWADPAGGLHVGPQSAGADPGPACYGRGGTRPTVTDANLVAGRLNPGYFLGGAMKLDLAAAERALAELGAPLGVDAAGAARGVLRHAITRMSHALRLVTVRRGYDPRDFTFVAYGGAGPLHATLLARELGIRRTVIPAGPGHFSAFGMLTGPLRGEAVRTVIGPLDAIDLAAAFAPAEQAARAELGPPGQGATLLRYAELRYRGQEHTLEIPVSSFDLTPLQDAFAQRCLEAYSFRLDSPLEIVSVRVSATAPVAGEVHWGHGGPARPAPGGQKGSRLVDLDPYGEPREVPVLGRDLLGADPVSGPCVIEEVAATTLVLPGQAVSADELGNLLIEEQP